MSIMDTENVEKQESEVVENETQDTDQAAETSEAAQVETSQSEGSEEEAKPLYAGKKVLKTQDELLQYVKELEEKDASVDEEGSMYEPKVAKSAKTKAEEVKITDDKQDLTTRLLLDPEAVVREIEEKAVAKIKKTTQDEKDREAAWNGFYKSNKDLEPFRDLVDMETSRLLQQWELEKKAVSWKEGFSVLSTNVRSIIKRIRESESDVSEVDTSRKGTGLSSSGDTHAANVAAQKKSKSFTDQLKSLQATKR